jgi:hypothetical protein
MGYHARLMPLPNPIMLGIATRAPTTIVIPTQEESRLAQPLRNRISPKMAHFFSLIAFVE